MCVGRSIMSAYIKKGSKLTVHLANQGNEHDYQVFIKTGSPPTETDYDYQMTRCVCVISLFMFTCVYWLGDFRPCVGLFDCGLTRVAWLAAAAAAAQEGARVHAVEL